MKYLIISTLPKDNEYACAAIDKMLRKESDTEVIYADEMNIHRCVGCNYCWLKTPGVCSIKDDYSKILIKYLKADNIIYITETKLGFVSYKLKNIIDRILPLATMYLTVKDGQMRHIPRYDKPLNIGLLYSGECDNEFMNLWLERVVINLGGKSLGAYSLDDGGELYDEADNDKLHA